MNLLAILELKKGVSLYKILSVLVTSLLATSAFAQEAASKKFVSIDLLGALPTLPLGISYGSYFKPNTYWEIQVAQHSSFWSDGTVQKLMGFYGKSVAEKIYARGGAGFRHSAHTVEGKLITDESVKKDFEITGTAFGIEASVGMNSAAKTGFYWGIEITGAFIPVATVGTSHPESDDYESSHDERTIEDKASLLATETSGNFMTIHSGYKF